MIRFVLKSALLLGLAATVLPLASGAQRESAPDVDLLGLAAGISEAASDLGGFCARAPQACAAANEVGAFAADRIEAGLSIGYGYLAKTGERRGETETIAATAPSLAPATEPATDPLLTGAVDAFGPPRPYLPPRPPRSETVAIPTPAPRT